MAEIPVVGSVEQDRTAGFMRVGGARETNHPRQVNLIIRPKSGGFRLKVQGDSALFLPLGEDWEDDIPLTSARLWGLVQDCRQAWHEAVSLYRNHSYVLQDAWDFSQRSEILEEILPGLALAGKRLFRAIFFPPTQGGKKFAALGKIGEVLAAATSRQSLWMRVTSDSFYAPWNLLYSRDLKIDGSDADETGFWGYQHVIEQAPGAGALEHELGPDRPLQFALQVDERIDTDQIKCNETVRTLLCSYASTAIQLVDRNRHDILAEALRTPPLLDHVLYFCCHARLEGDQTALRPDQAFLALTDDKRITPGQLDDWFDTNYFQRGPIVFLNACGAAQLNSIFYEGFVPRFLSRKASAVIGPQTDIPAVFAGQFARRFFEELFQGGGKSPDGSWPERQVGSILLKLRREFLRDYKNPLGLLYSPYRGADVFLSSALERQPETSSGH